MPIPGRKTLGWNAPALNRWPLTRRGLNGAELYALICG